MLNLGQVINDTENQELVVYLGFYALAGGKYPRERSASFYSEKRGYFRGLNPHSQDGQRQFQMVHTNRDEEMKVVAILKGVEGLYFGEIDTDKIPKEHLIRLLDECEKEQKKR